MNIWSTLERAVHLFPENVAVGEGDRRLTYRDVHHAAHRRLAALRRRGVGVGDRVALLDDNTPDFLVATFAIAGAGAIAVPMNTRLTAAELAAIVDDADPSGWLVGPRFAATASDAVERANVTPWVTPIDGDAAPDDRPAASASADDVAHLYYTSGTTGEPKGVMLTHKNECTHALAAIAELALTERDTWGHIAPMFHLADAWATIAITWVGGTHWMLPRFDPAAVLDGLEWGGVTITNLVPAMLNRVVKEPGAASRRYPALRLVLSGGAPIAPAVVREVMDVLGTDYVQTYGMTETSPYLTLSIPTAAIRARGPDAEFRARAKTGRPFLGVDLRVVTADGVDVPADGDAVGEILVRGETVTPGYWRKPDATAAAFTDGWLRTGDLATIDADGYVDIVDRKKDVVITGGENVYSTEVEAALYRHPAVLEAAVFGVPCEQWGEAVTAAVVLKPGASADAAALQAFARESLAGYKVPRAIRFLDALPRTGSGKIAKRLLRGG